MAARGLFGVVGGSVAAHHIGRGMAQEILDIEFSGVGLDCPGGEGVAEAMGVHLRDAGAAAQSYQDLLEAIGLEPDARSEGPVAIGGQEKGAWFVIAQVQVVQQSITASGGEGNHPLFVTLSVEDAESARFQLQVIEVQLHQF